MLFRHPSDWKPLFSIKLKYTAKKEMGNIHSRINKILVFLKKKNQNTAYENSLYYIFYRYLNLDSISSKFTERGPI